MLSESIENYVQCESLDDLRGGFFGGGDFEAEDLLLLDYLCDMEMSPNLNDAIDLLYSEEYDIEQ
jgi:hypothetical protein